MEDKPYSFSGFARLQPNQGSALGLSPGDKADLVTVQGPGGAKFTVARKIAGQFQRFVGDLGERGYQIDPKQSGGYANRNIRGSNRVSQHAFGNAIDLNWNANPLGSSKHNLPPDVGDIASKYGLVWGGTFSRPDPMHFEASRYMPEMAYDGSAASPAANGTNMPARRPTLSESMGAGFVPGMAVPGAAPTGQAVPGAMPIEALTAPTGRYSKLADALLAAAAGAKPKGWGDLLNASGDLALGYTLAGKEDKARKEYTSKLSQMLGGATTPQALTQTLFGSGDPDLVKAGVSAKLAAAKPKSEIGRFRPTKQGVVDTTTGQIVPGTEQKGTDNAEYGTSTKAFEDKDGNVQYMQFSKAGGGQPVKLPEGARWRPDVEIKDTGTEFVPVSKQTGQVIGSPIAKDVAGKQAQEEIGKARGLAVVDLPKVEGATNVLTSKIDQVMNDPYLPSMTGPLDGRLPNLSGDASRVQSRLDQLTGDAFLQAFGELKGGGAITEVEGAKAEKAKSRLATMTVNDPEYPVALKDFRDEVVRLRDLARARAGGGSPASAPASGASAPASGGYKVLKVH